MARDLNPKCKQCRREGYKLFLKGERCLGTKCALVKRNYIPGMHGPKQGSGSRVRISDYGKQFREKQKVKKMYRILEKQLLNYFNKASCMKGDVSLNMASLLERRFDNIIYRLGLSTSRDQARQLVSHGHFQINGKKVNVPSYQLNSGDTIIIQEKSLKNSVIDDNLKLQNNKDVVDWLMFEPKEKKGQVVHLPEEKDLDIGVDMKLIVGFYSK